MAARSSGLDQSMSTVVRALKMYMSPIPNMIMVVGEPDALLLDMTTMARVGSRENRNAMVMVGTFEAAERPKKMAMVAPNDAPDDTPVV